MAKKDTLEDLLEEEIDGWEEEVKKLEKQIPVDENEEESEEEDEVEKPSVDEDSEDNDLKKLQDKLEQTEKERRGLYKELKAERRTRQKYDEKLNQFESTLQQIIQQRQAATVIPAESKKFKGIPLEFTEDGDAFIPEEKLAELSKPLQEKIDNLQKSMKSTTGHLEETAAAQAALEKVLSEDERYPQVWNIYRGARKWANDQVIEWQKDNGVGGVIDSSDALSHIFDEDLQKDFEKQFPGLDLERIVTAEDGDYFLKRTLKSIADTVFEDKGTPDLEQPKLKQQKASKFEKVLKKPTGLGASADKRGGKSVIEMADSLSSLDALDLSDAQADALLRALEREEKVNGITFE